MRILFLFLFSSYFWAISAESKADNEKPVVISDGTIIDSLVVLKSERKLLVFSKSIKIKEYNVALGKNPTGHKQFEGDMKTPEGLYYIDAKSVVSKFHKNLNISYPNQKDKAYALEHGKNAGSAIKIHGLPNVYSEKNYIRNDWTWGCIALTNTEIDELYKHVKIGCSILINP